MYDLWPLKFGVVSALLILSFLAMIFHNTSADKFFSKNIIACMVLYITLFQADRNLLQNFNYDEEYDCSISYCVKNKIDKNSFLSIKEAINQCIDYEHSREFSSDRYKVFNKKQEEFCYIDRYEEFELKDYIPKHGSSE
jgi:hypothetical protein